MKSNNITGNNGLDPDDYDYVETCGCGETEVWEHIETKENYLCASRDTKVLALSE